MEVDGAGLIFSPLLSLNQTLCGPADQPRLCSEQRSVVFEKYLLKVTERRDVLLCFYTYAAPVCSRRGGAVRFKTQRRWRKASSKYRMSQDLRVPVNSALLSFSDVC